ncbi:hypothetical protein [Spiroplasma endosymbiont of Phycita roborella]|uniref:hypothetical protein n=1 Tax=Spiroplasma endosymbiont of Phycita roborella TaxID=3066311 RepID=UPI00313AB3B4
MKQLLMTLSTLTTLTLTSNTVINSINDNIVNNSSLTNKSSIKNSTNSLFNNQWNVLDTSDWITNQSITDYKFYSYDTSALKNYTFANAQNTFLVDTTGNLVYNTKVIVPDKDKSDIENTKQEMNNTKKVTTIKDTYNPYSKSKYSTSYFSGDNQDWKLIQQGGIEKHIDISQQAGADKVEHSDNLSETLGLYYIAKATLSNKIDRTIAQQLANYFISQSSLKEQINNELVTKIIDLIIDNKDIYNFIYNLPFNISDKNYSLNYIFDKDNNLIEIYYNKWNADPVTKNLNYKYSDSYNGTSSNNGYTSDTKIIFNDWTKYANNWTDFTNIFSTITFDNNSFISAVTPGGTDKKSNMSVATKNITETITIQFKVYSHDSVFLYWATLAIWINIWHDDHNVYLDIQIEESASGGTKTLTSNIDINDVSFISTMK